MASLIDNALASVMAVRTDPSATLSRASQAFNVSATLAGKIKDSLEKAALLNYKQQEQAYQNQVSLLQREQDMKLKVQLQNAGFAQQSSLVSQRFKNNKSLADANFTNAKEMARESNDTKREIEKIRADAIAKNKGTHVRNIFDTL